MKQEVSACKKVILFEGMYMKLCISIIVSEIGSRGVIYCFQMDCVGLTSNGLHETISLAKRAQ